MRRFILLCAAAVWLVAGLTTSAFAATKTWNCPTASGNWSNGANWGGTAPTTGDTLVFNCAVTSNADLSAGTRIAAVILGASSGGSIINGAIQFNSALAAASNVEDNANGATNTINATVQLANGRSWFKSSVVGHTLEFRGTISGIGTGGPIAVENGIRVYGPGTVRFRLQSPATNHTYLGDTTVHSADGNGGNGRLELQGVFRTVVPGDLIVGTSTTASAAADRPQAIWVFGGSVASTSKITVGPDGLLDLGAFNPTAAQLLGTGSVTSSGGVLNVGDAGDFTWGGVISGAGNVTKVGSGSMTYTAVNTYTGTTTVSGGTLVLGAPSKTIFGSLTIGLGVGTTTTATVRLANNYQINDTSLPITINADGKLDTGGLLEELGAVTMNGGQIALASPVRIWGNLTMNGGTITDTGGGELLMRSNVVATSTGPFGAASINATVVQLTSVTFTVNSGSTQPELTINGAVLKVSSSPDRNLIKTGAGTLRLTGNAANNYVGSTTIAQGTLELAKPDNVGAISGPIVIGNNTDPAGSATLKNMASNQLIGKPSVTINASGAFNLNSPGPSVQQLESIGSLAGAGSLLMPNFSTLVIDIPSGSATFGGTLSSQLSATSLIQKHGAGEQIFTGNGSAYVASASVFLGRLTVNSPGVLGSRVEIDNGGELGGTGQIGRLTAYGGGRVRPGNGSGGALSVGTTRFEAGSSLVIDATNTNVGRLNVTDSVTIHPTAVLELRAAPTFSVAENNFATFISNDGADAIQGAFRGLPEGRSAPVGPRNVTISYVGDDGNDATLTVRKTLDIDGDSQYLAETDGLLIRRFIQNLTGPALIANAVAPGARRTTDADILAYLQTLGSALDVNNSVAGAVDATDALLINRWMLGFRGEALVSGTATPPNFGDRSLYIANTELTLRTVMP